MKLVYQNIPGIGNSDTHMELSNVSHSHYPDLVCIYEPMVSFNSIPLASWNSLGLSLLTANIKNGLLPNIQVLYSTGYCSPTVISTSTQQITFQTSFDGVLS